MSVHGKRLISRIACIVSLVFALIVMCFLIFDLRDHYHDHESLTANETGQTKDETSVSGDDDIPTLAYSSDILDEISLPKLIQTVSDDEFYKGFVSYGDYMVHPIQTSDTAKACESVRACIVRISMNGASGSGIVWKMEPDRIVIATNRHVLRYWDDQTGTVSFVDGTVSNAKVIGMSGKHDVGFLQIPSGWLDYTSLKDIRQASYSMDAYNSLCHGEDEFGLGSANGAAADFYPGFIDSKDTYMADFGENMIYCDSNAIHGMSGGGTFDGYGNLVGMITGGSDYNVSLSVPLPSMIEAYNTLVSR